jgi:catecholate siderophore receptor
MSALRIPRSLRTLRSISSAETSDIEKSVIASAACLLAAGGATGSAEAQQAQAPLPPVTVDAPVMKKKVVTTSPSPAHTRARTAVRRRARDIQNQQAATPTAGPASSLPIMAQRAPGSNPYADPAAPYKVDRLSSSKFTEPVLNTPRSVTVLTKEVLEDKNATTLKEIGRSTAGVTLGSGEGGNAFGDRFFIRGFDARNDIFVDGVRDPGVSIRENFFTEQVEILRGPASSLAGRGTTGGAINIVTKKAEDRDFNVIETTLGSDQTKRVTVDVNKAISPILDARVNGMWQDADVAGRNFTTDHRNGIAAALTFKPLSNFTITADYERTYIYGRPDFGVPYNPVTRTPATQGTVAQDSYYGVLNRDFSHTTQNLGTLDAKYVVNDWLTFDNKFRGGYSILNYIGTIPENPSGVNASTMFSYFGLTQLNPQGRFETAQVLTDQPELTAKFNIGQVKNTVVFGAESSHERVSIAAYNGQTSEITTGAFGTAGSPIVSVYAPYNFLQQTQPFTLVNPLVYHVNTAATYLLETANFNDKLIFNGGVRFDNYNVTATAYPYGPGIPGIGKAGAGFASAGSQSKNSGIVSYNFGLVYKPIDPVSLYAAYATAAEPVGDEMDATSSAYGGIQASQQPAQVLGPQRSEAIEVGTKWELIHRHLLATFAAFQTTETNARETTPTGTPGYPTATILASAAYRVRGLDLELSGKLTDKWSVIGGFVVMNTDVLKSINPVNVGLPLANIAPMSMNLLTKYQVTPWLELGGQAVYASQILGGSLNIANGNAAYGTATVPTQLPSHWRFDTFAETQIGPYTTLKLYAANIFNRTYYDSLYQSGVPFIQQAPGRSVSLIATAKF